MRKACIWTRGATVNRCRTANKRREKRRAIEPIEIESVHIASPVGPEDFCISGRSSWYGTFLGRLDGGSIFKDTAVEYASTQELTISDVGIYGMIYRTANFMAGVSRDTMRCEVWAVFTRPVMRFCRCCCTFSKTDERCSVDSDFEGLLFRAAIRWLVSAADVSRAELPPWPVKGSSC